jgi:hypothetical protein
MKADSIAIINQAPSYHQNRVLDTPNATAKQRNHANLFKSSNIEKGLYKYYLGGMLFSVYKKTPTRKVFLRFDKRLLRYYIITIYTILGDFLNNHLI